MVTPPCPVPDLTKPPTTPHPKDRMGGMGKQMGLKLRKGKL